MPERLSATEDALRLIAHLRQQHGPVCFYLSHGCCDGTAPMCLAPGQLPLGADDVQLGTVGGADFWLGREQRDQLAHLVTTLDVAPGQNGNFSLEEGSGQRFALHLRPRSDDDRAAATVGARALPCVAVASALATGRRRATRCAGWPGR
jgi:uncharacterized protein (DUF779 family)